MGSKEKKGAAGPLGKLDHVGIAVRSIAEARKFYEDVLGAKYLYEHDNQEAGFRYAEFDLGGTVIELLEPLRADSFLNKFLDRHGEGFHHMTFDVPDSRARAAELKSRGVRIIDEKEHSPTSFEAFISPRSTHGVLIQIGSGFPTLSLDPEWERVVPSFRFRRGHK
jgi:methylmalonyl-CoA/ethylmalonyl-CoA epimerase